MSNLIKTDSVFPFFNDIFDDFFTTSSTRRLSASSLKTDILEVDNGYELRIDVPGFEKRISKLI